MPVVPGYHGDDQDPDAAWREARADRLPGADQGRGRRRRQGHARGRRAPRTSRPRSPRASARREPRSATTACCLEQYLTPPRHIEVQVFGDSHGNAVHLFERECSVQRRHQKVIEEAPAPGHDRRAPRRRWARRRSRAARAVGYVGAGTVEFIARRRHGPLLLHGDEHPPAGRAPGHRGDHRPRPGRVAAARRGRRAAAAAAGASSPSRGHAIEARLYAEDPARGLPAVRPARSAHLRRRRGGRARARRHRRRSRATRSPLLRPDDRQADRPTATTGPRRWRG